MPGQELLYCLFGRLIGTSAWGPVRCKPMNVISFVPPFDPPLLDVVHDLCKVEQIRTPLLIRLPPGDYSEGLRFGFRLSVASEQFPCAIGARKSNSIVMSSHSHSLEKGMRKKKKRQSCLEAPSIAQVSIPFLNARLFSIHTVRPGTRQKVHTKLNLALCRLYLSVESTEDFDP